MKYFYVYILLCNDKSYYTGHTDNIEKRMAEHSSGKLECYTSSRLPVKLVFLETFQYRDQALICEMKIKKWSRKKKEALIKKDWNKLKQLASRSKQNKSV